MAAPWKTTVRHRVIVLAVKFAGDPVHVVKGRGHKQLPGGGNTPFLAARLIIQITGKPEMQPGGC